MPSIRQTVARWYQRFFKSDWVPPRAPITVPEKLTAYSDEHVRYEVGMLIRAALFTPPDEPVDLGEFLKSARTEIFVLHLRGLIEFLYPDEYRPKGTTVCAHHFLESRSPYADWTRIRPALSDPLRRAKKRADQELAHLTTGRIAHVPAIKYWDPGVLLPEISKVLVVFAGAAATNRLGLQARDAIAELAKLVKPEGTP